MKHCRPIHAVWIIVPWIGSAGCADGAFDWSTWFKSKRPTPVDSDAYVPPLADSAAYRDTIAELAYFDGLRRLRVRGYGIVAGLGDNGSTTCPNRIKQQLIQEMLKTRKFAENRSEHITPEALISLRSTAVVAVEGEIGAAVPANTPFDIFVSALPGTQTVSLEGGWLYECNLAIFRPTSATAWIPGRTIASGAGPLFMNPVGNSDDAATKISLTRGVVIGGGMTQEDRRLRLMLTVPSYPRAIAIAARINDRFGGSVKIADAVSPAQIKLKLPRAYHSDPMRFVTVVQHLYLPLARSGFLAQRTRELSAEFVKPDAPHVEIALAWEGIGRTILPEVQKFYAHSQPACSFYAATAGLHLGDDVAVETIASHLETPDSPYRFAAIRVLQTASDSRRAARPLRRALNDSDPRVRVAAYEALVARDDPTLLTLDVGDGGFTLDIVPSNGDNLIYAKRGGQRRIVLFGDSISATPPVFYSSPAKTFVVTADQDATRLRLIRMSPVSGVSSPPFESPLDLRRLIAVLGGEPPDLGLGIDYSSVVLMLSELCRTESVNAQFLLQQTHLSSAPLKRSEFGRPESER